MTSINTRAVSFSRFRASGMAETSRTKDVVAGTPHGGLLEEKHQPVDCNDLKKNGSTLRKRTGARSGSFSLWVCVLGRGTRRCLPGALRSLSLLFLTRRV